MVTSKTRSPSSKETMLRPPVKNGVLCHREVADSNRAHLPVCTSSLSLSTIGLGGCCGGGEKHPHADRSSSSLPRGLRESLTENSNVGVSVLKSSLQPVQKLSSRRAYNVQTNRANVLTAATEDGFSLILDPRALQ